eukprot:gene24203-29395_t
MGAFACALTEAIDGSDALTKCEGTKFDSLLTDKSMPVMDGLTFLRRLKKSTNKPSLCVMYSADCIDKETERMKKELEIDSIWDKTEGVDQIVEYMVIQDRKKYFVG